MKKPSEPTKTEIEYVTRRVAEWIAAGDIIEEHALLAVNAAARGFTIMRDTFGSDATLEQWCKTYHALLKKQETMDPKEFYRIKRLLDRARREQAAGKWKPPWE